MIDDKLLRVDRLQPPRLTRFELAVFGDACETLNERRVVRTFHDFYFARVGNAFATESFMQVGFIRFATGEAFQHAATEIRMFVTVRAEDLPADTQFARVCNARQNFVDGFSNTPPCFGKTNSSPSMNAIYRH